MLLAAADALGSRQVETEAGIIDLDGEWRWLKVYDAVSEAAGHAITPDTDVETLRGLLETHELDFDPAWGAEKLVLEILGELVEPSLLQPTFLYDYPAVAQPLARQHRDDPRLIEAWDLIIAGVERGTGFTELIDPVVQRQVLAEQALLAAARRRRGHAARRGLPEGVGVRRASDGWNGTRHRPADHVVHRCQDPGDDPVPAPPAGGRAAPDMTWAPESTAGPGAQARSLPVATGRWKPIPARITSPAVGLGYMAQWRSICTDVVDILAP